jgi:hypothetical protein
MTSSGRVAYSAIARLCGFNSVTGKIAVALLPITSTRIQQRLLISCSFIGFPVMSFRLYSLSAVSQNRPLVVEIKGFKTSHF